MPKFTRPKAKSKPKSAAAANKPADRRTPPPPPPPPTEPDDTYISPNKIAVRWDTSRASVDRTARRENFVRFLLGDGKNGGVRYKKEEVIQYEKRRLIRPTPTI